jgi:multiple antibiotic resistance protein
MEFNIFWLCFVPLFVSVDAIGTLPIYMSLTEGVSPSNRRSVVITSVITAMVVALLFLFVGEVILRLLGITVVDFMIAGGIILFLISIGDLLAINKPLKQVSTESLGPVPLGVPLIVGPAVLTTIMVLVREHGFYYTAIATVLNIIIAGIVFLLSEVIMRLLGASGTKIVSKIASLFLAAIAVMMVRRGLTAVMDHHLF